MLHPTASRLPDLAASRMHPVRRRVLRALVVGGVVALLMLAVIKTVRPLIFEGRTDLVVEQCFKTGAAAFAFALLIFQARERKSGH